MVKVYLSLGSNIDRERYLGAALDALRDKFGDMHLSPVYESEAVGFEGDSFYNLVVGVDTDLPVGELARYLRGVEELNDRLRSGGKFSSRTLDIDILTYGQFSGPVDGLELPRDEILKYAFVLLPLADIAGDEKHPVLGETYRDLCASLMFEIKLPSETGDSKPGPRKTISKANKNSQKPFQKLWPVNFTWQGKQISSALFKR